MDGDYQRGNVMTKGDWQYLAGQKEKGQRRQSVPDILVKLLFYIVFKWCPGPDLNRHGRNGRGILSPLCLPISPPVQGGSLSGRAGYHVSALSKPSLT